MKTQSDKNLDFNGMAGTGVNRSANRLAKNQWSGHSNDGRLVNKGRGPTKGNQDYDVMQGAHREPPTAGVPSIPAQGSVRDSIKGAGQVRNPGGTKAVTKPSNPDAINVSGYKQFAGRPEKGSKPVKSVSDPDGMNYGPKKQY